MKRLVLAAVALTALVLSAPAAAARQFTDPAGDSGSAPDITEVQVGNDVVRGPIVVWVTTSNRTSVGAGDVVAVFLDTDLNRQTGWPEGAGADFAIDADAAGPMLHRWDGATFVQAPAPSLRASFVRAQKAWRIQIHPNDLGGTKAFNLYTVTTSETDDFDVAPDGASVFSYSLISGPLVLTRERASATRARAGQPFVVGMLVARDDIGEVLEEGQVTCALTVGGRPLNARSRGFVDGVAACGWQLPKTAKGKRVRATITVSYGGAKVSHTTSVVAR